MKSAYNSTVRKKRTVNIFANFLMVQRKTYDTRVKYPVMKGLLPDLYRRPIHESLISKWKQESPYKYTGFELNDNIEELYELMKRISEEQRLLRTIQAFYRVNKTLKDIIGTGNDYLVIVGLQPTLQFLVHLL